MENPSDCILGTDPLISESQDIDVSIINEFIHLSDQLDFTFKLSYDEYKTIRNNKNNAITITIGDGYDYLCFINLLEWNPSESSATFNVWIKLKTLADVPAGESVESNPGTGQLTFTGYAPTVTVFYTGTFRLHDTTSVCAETPIELYFNTYPSGVVFSDKQLTNWPAGYNYITMETGPSVSFPNPNIYEYNDSNGMVGADTTLDC
jgi:hypothetical protein